MAECNCDMSEGEIVAKGVLGAVRIGSDFVRNGDFGGADCGCEVVCKKVLGHIRITAEYLCGGDGGGDLPPEERVTIRLSETSKSLATDGAFQLQAIVGPADLQDKSVTWTSSDPTVATVDQDGNVTAVGPGTATITATTTVGGKSASCLVTVTNEPPENNASKKWFLFEVGPRFHDGSGGNCVVINEIEIYDAALNKITLAIPESPAYDSVTEGKPRYWNVDIGGRNKLTDGQWSYANNAEGGDTSCSLLHSSTSTDMHWARFVGHVEKTDVVDKIRLYAGGNEGRTPQYVKVWQILHDDVDRYVTQDRLIDDGLLLLETWTYTEQMPSGSYTDKTVQMV